MPIAAIILAAGVSSRMGRNKLLEEIGGKPMVRCVAEAALASCARPVLVVVGNEAETVRGALVGLELQTVANADYREGLSASIRVGVSAVPASGEGALILMGDMPRISASLIDRLISNFAPEKGWAICVASHRGQRGHPVLFDRRFFPDLLGLEGDAGARHLVESNEAQVCKIETDDDSPLADIDTPAALAKIRASLA